MNEESSLSQNMSKRVNTKTLGGPLDPNIQFVNMNYEQQIILVFIAIYYHL